MAFSSLARADMPPSFLFSWDGGGHLLVAHRWPCSTRPPDALPPPSLNRRCQRTVRSQTCELQPQQILVSQSTRMPPQVRFDGAPVTHLTSPAVKYPLFTTNFISVLSCSYASHKPSSSQLDFGCCRVAAFASNLVVRSRSFCVPIESVALPPITSVKSPSTSQCPTQPFMPSSLDATASLPGSCCRAHRVLLLCLPQMEPPLHSLLVVLVPVPTAVRRHQRSVCTPLVGVPNALSALDSPWGWNVDGT